MTRANRAPTRGKSFLESSISWYALRRAMRISDSVMLAVAASLPTTAAISAGVGLPKARASQRRTGAAIGAEGVGDGALGGSRHAPDVGALQKNHGHGIARETDGFLDVAQRHCRGRTRVSVGARQTRVGAAIGAEGERALASSRHATHPCRQAPTSPCARRRSFLSSL